MKFNLQVDLLKTILNIFMIVTLILNIVCCEKKNHNVVEIITHKPVIEPDFINVTIPPNIAPLNFVICENEKNFIVKITSGETKHTIKTNNGVVRFPLKMWKKMLSDNIGGSIEIEIISNENNKQKYFVPFKIFVAREPIDPYLCYRLLFTGFQSWGEMKIMQRSVETFGESIVFENKLVKGNCVNCHSFIQNDPGKFLLHVRGSEGGTYFSTEEKITRRNLRVGEMKNNAVYPAWHPSGKYIVFSSNEIIQAYNLDPEKRIVVYDQESPLVFYSVDNNEVKFIADEDSIKNIYTFPFWSSEGDFLYYCRTRKPKNYFNYKKIMYSLASKPFDLSTGQFGQEEVIFDATPLNKSISLPSISPDGKFLVFVMHDYGTFPIWHKEADLYLLEKKSGLVSKMNINSDQSESYHSWSSNSKWLVFSSKRGDGLTARPYFAYVNTADSTGKPFVLPQKNPNKYQRLDKTYNRPEFITGKIKTGPRDFMRAANKIAIDAMWDDADAE